jgi:hypothetical protein
MTSSRISSGIESMTSGSAIERSTPSGAEANKTLLREPCAMKTPGSRRAMNVD